MIEQVLISGQIGKAVYVEDGAVFVVGIEDPTQPRVCRHGEVSLLFDCKAEFTQITDGNIGIEKIQELLEDDTDRQRALTFLISGFDDELSDDTRRLSIEVAEEILQNVSVLDYAKARLLARPLPMVADIKGAVLMAEQAGAETVSAVYKEVIESQEATQQVLDGWNQVPEGLFSSNDDRTVSEAILIEVGAIGAFVSAVTSKDSNKLSMSILSYSQQLKTTIPNITHILNAIRTHILAGPAFASGKSKQPAYKEPDVEQDSADAQYDPIQELILQFENERPNWKPRAFTPAEALERVEKQIDAIKRLIVQGNVSRAYAYLHDLIRFNLEHGKTVHVGMTLCSLAKAALDANAIDVADQLVGYALLLNIEDPVIPNTYAQVFKAKGEFDKALSAYEETILRFPNYVVTRNGYAETLKAKGEFDKALSAYEEAISRFPDDVVARTGYAETLKAKGEFDKALSAYQETISRFPNDVVARNGYAETLKARGEFDKALSAYQETISRFPDDVFAHTGYAETLKAKGEFDKALSAYEEAISRFPDNAVARNGYAETLKAKGEFDRALSAYAETMEQFPNDRVARTGYASVLMLLGRFNELEAVLSGRTLVTKSDWVALHIRAMSYLKRGNLDLAIETFEYGLFNSPWHDTKEVFVTALGVARIKKREFAKAVEVLSDNVIQLDVFQRETRLALIGHSQAELGRKQEAADSLNRIENSKDPHVINLKDKLKRRYSYVYDIPEELSESEKDILDKQIEDTEVFLAIAA